MTQGRSIRLFLDYVFASPSAAAAVVSGRSANGWVVWSVEGTGQTYAAWQDQQLSALQPSMEDA